MEIKELSYDILKELFNISVGKSAKMLSEITNKKIILSVPRLEIIDSINDVKAKSKYLEIIPSGRLMVSSIDFGHILKGQANLIFPANKMRRFINLCMNDNTYTDEDMEFTDIDFDVIREVGNIILNAILGGMSNLLNINLEYTLPEVEVFYKQDFTNDIQKKDKCCILLLFIDFIIQGTEIEGALVIDLTLSSLNELLVLIEEAKENSYG